MIPFNNISIPSSCVLCNADIKRNFSLCHACEADLPIISHACKTCGIPLKETQSICGHCLNSTPDVDYSINLFHYESPIDYLITELKFSHRLSHARILGSLLKQHLLNNSQQYSYPEAIIPVPLHKRRLIKRGFNQSLEIAKEVTKTLEIPVHNDIVLRDKATRAQSELDLKQRKRNIKGCFTLINQNEMMSAYPHIVIIDDVVTTGATTNELAKVLKQAGVKKVGVWSIARAVLGSLK